jgi:hypothetical protein
LRVGGFGVGACVARAYAGGFWLWSFFSNFHSHSGIRFANFSALAAALNKGHLSLFAMCPTCLHQKHFFSCISF